MRSAGQTPSGMTLFNRASFEVFSLDESRFGNLEHLRRIASDVDAACFVDADFSVFWDSGCTARCSKHPLRSLPSGGYRHNGVAPRPPTRTAIVTQRWRRTPSVGGCIARATLRADTRDIWPDAPHRSGLFKRVSRVRARAAHYCLKSPDRALLDATSVVFQPRSRFWRARRARRLYAIMEINMLNNIGLPGLLLIVVITLVLLARERSAL